MATIKISELANIPSILGNTLIPVVSNVAGSLSTVKANVNQIRSFILGAITTSDLANISSNVNTLFSNAAVQSGNIAQLFANAAIQSGVLADLVSNAATQSQQIATVQNDLNLANLAMRSYVDAALASNIGDIVDGTTFTGNITLANITVSDVTGHTAIYATNTNGNLKLVTNGSGVIDVSNAKISNLSDPTDTQDAVTVGYLNTTLSTSVTNLISDDTEVSVTDTGSAPGCINNTVDGNVIVRINPANVEISVDTAVTGNLLPGANLTYSLGSSAQQWSELWVGNSSIYVGGIPLTITNANLIVNGFDVSASLAAAVVDINDLQANAAVQAGLIAVLDSNAAVQAGAINSLQANAAAQAGLIAVLDANAAVQTGLLVALEANAAVQAGLIADLIANAGTQAGFVEALYTNAAIQASEIANLFANAEQQNTAINAISNNAGGQANTISAMQANISTNTANIDTLFANAAAQAGQLGTLTSQISDTNIRIGTVETNLISNVSSINSTIDGIVQYSNARVASYLPVYSGNIQVNTITLAQILNANANGLGNIGNTSTRFNTVFAVATSAQYADLAENYLADAQYEPGTVVVFGGSAEITVSGTSHDHRIAGVISTEPAHIMNAGLETGLPVALVGRVPCTVVGEIHKGDLLVQSNLPGVATRLTQWVPGCVIGKALENYSSDQPGIIEVTVGKI